jgi:hypothetical protein
MSVHRVGLRPDTASSSRTREGRARLAQTTGQEMLP